jgi:gas vesicle protein
MKKRMTILGALIIGVIIGASVAMTVSTTRTAARSTKIRRTILLRFKPEATPADIQKIAQDVKATIGTLKGVHNLYVGPQLSDKVPFGYGISMDFDDENALKAYRTDQEHRRTHNDYVHLIDASQITDIRDE